MGERKGMAREIAQREGWVNVLDAADLTGKDVAGVISLVADDAVDYVRVGRSGRLLIDPATLKPYMPAWLR